MNSEPESMDALLGEPPSDPSSSSVERGKFSLLRVFGLFSAFFFLVFFLFLLGISLNEITVGTMIWVIAVSLVPSLFLLIRFGKVFCHMFLHRLPTVLLLVQATSSMQRFLHALLI